LLFREGDAEVDGRRGLADAPFLIGHRNDFHFWDWGAHAPRVLAMAPPPSRTVPFARMRWRSAGEELRFGEGCETGTQGRVRSPEIETATIFMRGAQ
jgi:hypothetical protein